MPFQLGAYRANPLQIVLSGEHPDGIDLRDFIDVSFVESRLNYILIIDSTAKIGNGITASLDLGARGTWLVKGEVYGKGGDGTATGRRVYQPFLLDAAVSGDGGGGAGFPAGVTNQYIPDPKDDFVRPGTYEGADGSLTVGGSAGVFSNFRVAADKFSESEIGQFFLSDLAEDGGHGVFCNHQVDCFIYPGGVIAGGGGGGRGARPSAGGTNAELFPRNGGDLGQSGFNTARGDSDDPIDGFQMAGLGGNAVFLTAPTAQFELLSGSEPVIGSISDERTPIT